MNRPFYRNLKLIKTIKWLCSFFKRSNPSFKKCVVSLIYQHNSSAASGLAHSTLTLTRNKIRNQISQNSNNAQSSRKNSDLIKYLRWFLLYKKNDLL